MKINSNMQALIAQNVLRTNEEKNAASTERLSSGFKINHAKDSPAGMAIGNRMHSQIKSLYKAKDNASNAINVVQTADGALTEVHNMLQRMNELGVKASSGTLTTSDREAIQKEVDALRDEIERVAKDTEYNTQNLLGGEQRMKGYTNDERVKVVEYDAGFPKGVYTVVYNADPEKCQLKKDGATQPVKAKFDFTGDDKMTITLDDGSAFSLSYSDKDAFASAEIDLTGIGGMKIQVGTATGQEIQVVVPKMDPKALGIGKEYNAAGDLIDHIDMRTQEGARESLD